MASTTLYPPIVESITPAFVVANTGAGYCRLFFSLSKYSSSTSPLKAIHISVVKQSTGQSVVNRVDHIEIGNENNSNRYRKTGIIILNIEELNKTDTNNLYFIDILDEDIVHGDEVGWYIGWIYKIQIRLSTVPYNNEVTQTTYLNNNASYFSEWSTYSTTKAIGIPRITIPVLNNFDSHEEQSVNRSKEYNLTLSTLDFNGTYSNADESETLYSYRLKLFNLDNELIEDSDLLYSNQYYTPNQFHYLFKTELQNETDYYLTLEYTTINK